MQIRRVAHVNLSVDDLAVAETFYGSVLRLSPAERPPDAGVRPGCWFQVSDFELHLSLEPHADNLQSRRHVAFEVLDLDAARETLVRAGATPEEGRPVAGIRRFFVRDPAGNRLEFFVTTSE